MKSLLLRLHRRLYPLLDRAGIHLLPKHYYSPVPDHAWLRSHPEAWQRPLELDWNLDEQLAWLEEVMRGHEDEARALDVDPELGQGYGAVEEQVLYGFVRSWRPERIVEVGGGVSTGVMAAASARNERPSEITTIEPFPRPALQRLGGVKLLRQLSQLVPATVFASLAAGDLLFVDSTHVAKTGSDVVRLYLEIVPALAAGVYVHVHDVTLPYLFHRTFGNDFYDWQESALVFALLTGNAGLRVRCCLSALHYERQDELRRLFPGYQPQPERDGLATGPGNFPSSLWLEVRQPS
jgi:hypothetical protein